MAVLAVFVLCPLQSNETCITFKILQTDKKLIEHAIFFGRYLLLEKSTKYLKRNFLKPRLRHNEKGQNLMLT